jgi:hypothetical protein
VLAAGSQPIYWLKPINSEAKSRASRIFEAWQMSQSGPGSHVSSRYNAFFSWLVVVVVVELFDNHDGLALCAQRQQRREASRSHGRTGHAHQGETL